jgi:hypothetical protein
MVRFFFVEVPECARADQREQCAQRFVAHVPLGNEAGYAHVRRRSRQHAQVAKTFKATARCDA